VGRTNEGEIVGDMLREVGRGVPSYGSGIVGRKMKTKTGKMRQGGGVSDGKLSHKKTKKIQEEGRTMITSKKREVLKRLARKEEIQGKKREKGGR